MRTLLVTLEIDVDDLSEKDRAQCARDMQCGIEQIPDMSEVSAAEFSNLLEGIGMEGSVEYFFAGSDIYAEFKECRVLDCDWKDERSPQESEQ
jgi:hypothetical protein